jgi:hypothetical protein
MKSTVTSALYIEAEPEGQNGKNGSPRMQLEFDEMIACGSFVRIAVNIARLGGRRRLSEDIVATR